MGTSAVPSAEVRSAAAVAGPTPGPEEVIVKKGCSGHCAEADGCMVRGEDLPVLSTWGQRGSRHALCSASGGKGGH